MSVSSASLASDQNASHTLPHAGACIPLPAHAGARGESVLRRDVRASIADGASFSLMVGLGETYLSAFVLALGMGDIAAGMIATVPMMLGAVLQLISPWAVTRLGSHRRWVVLCARIQAASLLLLPLAALSANMSWLIFVAATIYWGAGLATGPAWNTWIEAIIPRPVRARFFASRVRISQACILAGFLLGGVLLQTSPGMVSPACAFGILFLIAAAARFVSAVCLARQSEPRFQPDRSRVTSAVAHDKFHTQHGGAKLVIYLMVLRAAVYIAGPFFAPFMLSNLKMSYLEFTLLVALGYVGKVVVSPMWGKFAQKYGALPLLWIGGIGIVPLSALWLVSQSIAFLAFLQIISGIVWAAHELAMFLLFIETIPKEKRTRVLTVFNLGESTAIVCGGVLGALLLNLLGAGSSAYLWLFAISSVVRAGTLILLARIPRPTFHSITASTRTVAVRPSSGSIEQPILASVEVRSER